MKRSRARSQVCKECMLDHRHNFDTEKLRNKGYKHDQLNILSNFLLTAMFKTCGDQHKVQTGDVPRTTVHVKQLSIVTPHDSQITDAKLKKYNYFQYSKGSTQSHIQYRFLNLNRSRNRGLQQGKLHTFCRLNYFSKQIPWLRSRTKEVLQDRHRSPFWQVRQLGWIAEQGQQE